MALKSVSLKLLPVLQALLRHQSVTGAARALCVSPSAVSESLARLREILGDALLVRVGSRMRLTARATELIVPLEELAGNIERFFQRNAFDPGSATRTFVIATSDILAYTYGPELFRVVRAAAPGVRLHFVDVTRDLPAKLAERHVDFAFLPKFALADLAPAPLRFRQLDLRRRVVLMCKKHPLAAKAILDRDDVLSCQHVAFSPDPVMVGASSALRLSTGDALDVAVRIPFMNVVPSVLPGSDLVALVGETFARDVSATFPLAYRPIDFEIEPAPRGMVWSPVQDGDLAHEWLRTKVADGVEWELARRNAPDAAGHAPQRRQAAVAKGNRILATTT